jgi:hypothetical protein
MQRITNADTARLSASRTPVPRPLGGPDRSMRAPRPATPSRRDTTMTIDCTPVAPPAARTLAASEAIVARGLTMFVEVGHALLAVRDRRLYREAAQETEE